ncbi:unnamed protein product [Parajaminaea phylloscopi]
MANATQRDILSSAITFAGGLALGVGGAYALSRNSFKPANAPTKSTKAKAEKALGITPKAPAIEKEQIAPKEAPATDAKSSPKPPASEQLDSVDAKGTGPAAPQPVKGDGPVLSQRQPVALRHSKAVAGGDYPEAPLQQRARTAHLRADLGDAPEAATPSTAAAPAWLAGLVDSPATRDLTSQGAIEGIAYSKSDALFVYESGANAGFGSWAEKESVQAASKGWVEGRPKVVSMQTRTGAGTAIAGYMSSAGNASSGSTGQSGHKTITALTNAAGLLAMAPSVVSLPPPAQGRLVAHVSSASQDVDTESLAVKNDYASVLSAASTLAVNDDIAVVLSGTRQEAVDVAAAAYSASGHLVHVFDGAYAGREVAPLNAPAQATKVGGAATVDIVAALEAKSLRHFSYYGPGAPSAVLVVPNGSHATSARIVLATLPKAVRSSVGVIAARIVRPWSDEELIKAIPQNVKTVFVLDEARAAGTTGPLFEDVQSTIFGSGFAATAPRVFPVALSQGHNLEAGEWTAVFAALATSKGPVDANNVIASAPDSVGQDLAVLGGADSRIATFYDADSNATVQLANFVARTLRERVPEPTSAELFTSYDNYEAGGLVRSDILIGAHSSAQIPVHLAAQRNSAATVVIADPSAVLKTYKAFETLREGGAVLVNSPGWDAAEFAAKLRAEDKKTLAAKKARVYLIDAAAVVAELLENTAKARGGNDKINENTVPKEVATVVLAAAFYHIHLDLTGATLSALLERFLGVAPVGAGGAAGLVAATEKALAFAGYDDAAFAAAEPIEGEDSSPREAVFRYNAFGPNADAGLVGLEAAPVRSTWALPAWQLLFSEAYKLDRDGLRPDLHEKNYVVTVTENRRLTPADYDRNVFHMELSTAGTGLKYEVGEALGVHGWNDEAEVRDFLDWSGYDPDELIAVPSLEDPSRYDTRSVFQILQQRLDIFGKPGKSFYEALSKLATNKDEAKWLRFISAPEGNSTFKKLSEVETVTYAEVLQMFPSARLPLDVLLREVAPIEPRHYSIASAQAAVGDSVHLLIVTVDWQTPSGSPRYGQCTRYLANLRVGAKVTVSLKPSIMKLPPHPTQPIVMAGLGTGMAPFRAYVQAREVQKRQGIEVGPMLLFFGSRSKYAEWLYGEEFEAAEQDDLLKLGLAFSRDQAHKIYIQDKVREESQLVAKYLAPDLEKLKAAGGPGAKDVDIVDLLTNTDEKRQGMFALCGPTWPVPDVTEAIINAFVAKGMNKEEAERHIEAMKEREQFVLEVY